VLSAAPLNVCQAIRRISHGVARFSPAPRLWYTKALRQVFDPTQALNRDAECGAPYGSSEVIHRSGAKARIRALERERHQNVNNFAVSASAGYELAPPPPRRIVGEFRAG
jgi:hypothetical protein